MATRISDGMPFRNVVWRAHKDQLSHHDTTAGEASHLIPFVLKQAGDLTLRHKHPFSVATWLVALTHTLEEDRRSYRTQPFPIPIQSWDRREHDRVTSKKEKKLVWEYDSRVSCLLLSSSCNIGRDLKTTLITARPLFLQGKGEMQKPWRNKRERERKEDATEKDEKMERRSSWNGRISNIQWVWVHPWYSFYSYIYSPTFSPLLLFSSLLCLALCLSLMTKQDEEKGESLKDEKKEKGRKLSRRAMSALRGKV